MSIETDIRDTTAAAVKEACRLFSTCSYSHKGGTATTGLYCVPGAIEKTSTSVHGSDAEVQRRRFAMPYQTSFPPSNGIEIGDEITYANVVWRVVDYDTDAVGAVYRMETEKVKQRKIGR